MLNVLILSLGCLGIFNIKEDKMMHKAIVFCSVTLSLSLGPCTSYAVDVDKQPARFLLTKEQQQSMTPQEALMRLKLGNKRFLNGKMKQVDYLLKVKRSEPSQHPAALILSCIDSRVPPEIIFDQAIGNIFVARTAGTVLDDVALGGMEYATKVAGAKAIVVLAHEDCGAATAACKNVKLGHITKLLQKFDKALIQTKQQEKVVQCNKEAYIDTLSANNARNITQEIVQRSPIIKALVDKKELKIVSAIYHTDTGEVEFLNSL